MTKTFKPYSPDQTFLFPPSPHDWLQDDHLAYFVSDLVDQMDLSGIEAYYKKDTRGQPPYHPQMMVKILIYAYCTGIYSSRRIAKRIQEDVAFRVLAAGNDPDFRTISDFRKNHLSWLQKLFEQVLVVAKEAEAIKVGRVVLDGTKVKANASKHKAMSYGRMEERSKDLKEEIKDLLRKAERTDTREDEKYGPNRRGDELPEELRHRKSRLKRIREAMKVVEQRAREKAEKEEKPPEEARPKEKDQYNFTDPESRIVKGNEGFIQGYNAQIAVDPEMQLIVGQAVTQEPNDKQQLVPMIETVEAQSGIRPTEVVADSGYCSESNLEYCESADESDRKIEAYIATDRTAHGRKKPAPTRGRLPKNATRVQRMTRKLKTRVGAAIYAARKGIVEPVIGQIKHARGFRQFLLRGLEKVRGEWSLICTAHNILKLYRFSEG